MVNLFSDTQTRPTPAMREAIASAEVGDEQRRADPTVIALEERIAELLGQEAALFRPSGTMCNEIAIRVHIRPGGDEILLGRDTHPLRFEGGLQTDPLALDEYALVMPRHARRNAACEPLHPVDLRGLNLIGFKTSGSTERVIDQLRADGIEPHFVLRSDDNNVVQGFVAAGFGAALIPRLAAELLTGSFEVRPFEPALPPRIIGLAWTRDLADAPWLQTFIEATRRVVSRIWAERALERNHDVPQLARVPR